MIQIPPEAVPITIQKGPGGYGFNLGRKGVTQFFKAVDAGGPAEASGAAANDVIVEINGIAIVGLTHKDLVRPLAAPTLPLRTLPILVAAVGLTHPHPAPGSTDQGRGRCRADEDCQGGVPADLD